MNAGARTDPRPPLHRTARSVADGALRDTRSHR